ncbi:hypothetical protein EG832_21875, partial [bacterium]|nr:hypothetical protein [bacterium]
MFITVILITAISCIKDPTLPVVNTDPATEISITSVQLSGTVTGDGGAEITARGFCWGTEPDPTMDDELVPAGIGKGNFSATLESLEPNTHYNVRAFAENSVGIAYGNNVEFVTNTAPPA